MVEPLFPVQYHRLNFQRLKFIDIIQQLQLSEYKTEVLHVENEPCILIIIECDSLYVCSTEWPMEVFTNTQH